MSKLTTIDFHDDTLFAVEAPGGVFVAIKPISDRLGLDWRGQRQRIQRNAALAKGGCVMPLPSPGGAQEQFCLRLDLVNGWLFGIDAERVSDEARPRVLAYQEECCAVLFRHFYGRHAGVPEQNASPAREEPVPIRRQLVTEARQTFGPRAAGSLWFALGLPTVSEMQEGAPQQGAFGFTYTAIPAAAERSA